MIELKMGDCLSVMKNIPDCSIDMVLADLPYGTTKQRWDSVIDMKLLWAEYKRVTKPRAAILLFAKPPFDKSLACSNLDMYRYDWVWHKTRATGHLNANKMPLQAHEYICVFYRMSPQYHPQKTSGHPPVKNFYTRKSGECYGNAKNQSGGGSTERYPISVLQYPPVPNKDRLHPNQKPVDLIKQLILTYTSSGETVLDNTMGSGSTPLACSQIERHCIGIDKDLNFYGIAKSRLDSLTTQEAV